MSYILTYLMIGVAFAALYDLSAYFLESDNSFTNKERVWVVLIWPIALVIFVITLIKVFTGNE